MTAETLREIKTALSHVIECCVEGGRRPTPKMVAVFTVDELKNAGIIVGEATVRKIMRGGN